MKISFTQFKPKNSVCVVDNVGGSYLPIAHRLSEHFDKVYYHSINQNPFPRISLDMIGTGYDNIERIDEFWKRLDDFDIIVFPDIYFNDFGYHLRKIGKKVWGGTLLFKWSSLSNFIWSYKIISCRWSSILFN